MFLSRVLVDLSRKKYRLLFLGVAKVIFGKIK